MRKIFSQIVSKNYVTKSPTRDVPKGGSRGTTTNSIISSTPSAKSATNGPPLNGRSISMSSSPGSIPTSSSTPIHRPPPVIPVANIGPLLLSSSSGYPVPQFVRADPVPDVRPQHHDLERERRRRSHYSSLLENSVNLILGGGIKSDEAREAFLYELNVKRVLGKNEEMKKVIFKVAAMALAQNEEVGTSGALLHPFIITAGEVFFGGSYNEMGLGEESIQDILTPGLLVLLLHTLFPYFDGEQTTTVPSNKHLLLAKALVETSAGYLLHRTVEETNHLMEDTPENSRHFERMHQGNKLATLTGDLLVVSLIKNVACTGNNQVLELVMNSLSEFSTTEIAKRKPFLLSSTSDSYTAMKPSLLAESIVFAKGFQSSMMLSGLDDPEMLASVGHLGTVTGLLWKNNFDWMKLTSLGKRVTNVDELNDYLAELTDEADRIMMGKEFIPSNHPVIGIMRSLIHFWGAPKYNLIL